MIIAVLLVAVTVTSLLDVTYGHETHVKASRDRISSALDDALLSYMCRGENGIPCSGHGSCSRGMCTCHLGYHGATCEIGSGQSDITVPSQLVPDLSGLDSLFPSGALDTVTTAGLPVKPTYCSPQENDVCSRHGQCRNGECTCDDGYSGKLCELSHNVGFCNTYKECAECTAFMMTCPSKCDKMGNFFLVFGFPATPTNFRRCRFKSASFQCTFYFQQEKEDMSGRMNVMVKACLDYSKLLANRSDTVTEQIEPELQNITLPAQTTATPVSVTTVSRQPVTTAPEDDHDHEHGVGDSDSQTNPGSTGTAVQGGALIAFTTILLLLR